LARQVRIGHRDGNKHLFILKIHYYQTISYYVETYDGDGKADLAVYHRETGVWELFLSTRGYLEFSGDWGGSEYQPATE
jgi:hypothetical protein